MSTSILTGLFLCTFLGLAVSDYGEDKAELAMEVTNPEGGVEMSRFERFMMGTCVIALALCGASAYAGESPSTQTAQSKWQFDVIPYFWMAGMGGDVTVRGREADISTSFSDIWDNLDLGAQLHAEAKKGCWGLFFDGTYLDLSRSGEVVRHPVFGPTEGEVEVTEWLIELGGLYEAAKWTIDKDRAVYLDVLGGGRYWDIETEITLSNPALDRSFNVSGSEDWIDPFVGLRLRADLGKNFLLALRGDLGGFGVGSDFSWNASVVLGYKFTRLISAYVGYRALSVDYEDGSGDDRFVFDVIMHGPMIGLGFHF